MVNYAKLCFYPNGKMFIYHIIGNLPDYVAYNW